MPYPNGLSPNLADLAMGITPITTSVIAASAGLAALGAWRVNRHWKKIQQPGHFDKLDAGCAKLLHIAPANLKETRAHLDEWDTSLKERARKFLVTEIEAGNVPMVVWERTNGDEADIEIGPGWMTIIQPRATSPAF